MAKKKPSALEALQRLDDERAALDRRTLEAKRAAAVELGLVALDAGAAALGPEGLRQAVTDARRGAKTPGAGDADADARKPGRKGSNASLGEGGNA